LWLVALVFLHLLSLSSLLLLCSHFGITCCFWCPLEGSFFLTDHSPQRNFAVRRRLDRMDRSGPPTRERATGIQRKMGRSSVSLSEVPSAHGCYGGMWHRSWRVSLDVAQNLTAWLWKHAGRPWRQSQAFGRRAMDLPQPTGDGRPGQLTYPAEFTPDGMCNMDRLRQPFYNQLPGDRRATPWQDASNHFTEHLAMDDLLSLFEDRGLQLSRFVINLGAAEGHCIAGLMFDPANCLLLAGFGGLAFEGMDSAFQPLQRLFADRGDVRLVLGMTSPQKAAEDITHLAPRDPDLLKIDLDNCDVCFVEAALKAGSRPKLIHVEIADAPPPIIVRWPFNDGPKAVHRLSSLSAFLAVVRPYGYSLLHVEFMNAVLIRVDLAALIPELHRHTDEEKWRIGYFCHPLRTTVRWSPAVSLRRMKHFDSARMADLSTPISARLHLAKTLFVDAEVSLDVAIPTQASAKF